MHTIMKIKLKFKLLIFSQNFYLLFYFTRTIFLKICYFFFIFFLFFINRFVKDGYHNLVAVLYLQYEYAPSYNTLCEWRAFIYCILIQKRISWLIKYVQTFRNIITQYVIRIDGFRFHYTMFLHTTYLKYKWKIPFKQTDGVYSISFFLFIIIIMFKSF